MTAGKVLNYSFNPRTHAGCDPIFEQIINDYERFNPRTHAGCDISRNVRKRNRRVSIHAPTQGATKKACIPIKLYKFQSTHPRRVRRKIKYPVVRFGKFQSTHPRRVRQCRWEGPRMERCFNPRTHAGCDFLMCIYLFHQYLFQSTHPRRVRLQTGRCRTY